MLKLKLHYFGHLTQSAESLEKTLMLGKIEGQRRRKRQRMRWLHGITDSMESHVGGATCRTPPIPGSALEKDPRPGPLFEGNPVGDRKSVV